ncbi:MAG: pilus assembly protein PilP [Xanthomonadales bacterium]|nr:pilus assembly protein PilP [Xanthomonadales bacterium]
MIKIMPGKGRIIFCLLFVASLQACTGNMDEVKRYVNEIKQRPANPVEPIPPIATYVPVSYHGEGARNPFAEIIMARAEVVAGPVGTSGPQPDLERPREFLEQFSLDTLKMVGTFSRGNDQWVLIKDPDLVIHRVSVGEFMGQNRGKVIAIYQDHIELSELIPNGTQGWLIREAAIALNE